MAQGKAFAGSNQLGFPITLPTGEVAFAQAYVLVDPITGTAVGSGGSGSSSVSNANNDLDTTGSPVPTYKAHAYTYDDSGNIKTDTVTDGVNTWVRTYAYVQGQLASDSGWVKQ
jgi:YD repeat-containing protein